MKKRILLLIVSIFSLSICVQSQPENKQLQKFKTALVASNTIILGDLQGEIETKDISKLTYDRYMELLKKDRNRLTKMVMKIIKRSNKHLFAVKNNSFLIAIYSKRLNAVLYDDADTTIKTDSVHVLSKNEKIPDLNEFIHRTRFTVKNN